MSFPVSLIPLKSLAERLDSRKRNAASTETIPGDLGSTRRHRDAGARGIGSLRTSRKLLVRVLLVLLAVSQPPALLGASQGSSSAPASGTYRGRVLTELFRHRQERARQSDSASPAVLPAISPVLQQDEGEIAVIDDSDGVVLRPNLFDLNTSSVTLTRFDTGYTSQPGPLTLDETARNNGLPLSLGDDDAVQVFLPFPFPFFDASYSVAFVHSDGNLTFVEPDAASSTRSLSRAISGPPRISPLFTDLDPTQAQAAISMYSTGNRFVVTWDNVPQFRFFGIGQRQTFQLVLHPDGTVEFHFADVSLNTAVVGIMPGYLQGQSTPADFDEGVPDPVAGALGEIFSPITTIDCFALTQKFYRNHDDAYDFIVVFNDFRLPAAPGAFAFEVNVRNEVLGIGDLLSGGQTVFDFGPDFGSPRRLQSFLNMGPLSNYPPDPTERIPVIGQNNTLSVMGQEAGHRFLVFVRFRDPANQQISSRLLGRDQAHWSFFFNSDASVVEGNRIEDRGMVSPRFETIAAVEQYNDFDQYLMGLRDAGEVQPSFLVENSTSLRSPSSAPSVGVSFDGDRKEIAVDMIIDAEGQRIPHRSVSQKNFNFAFVLLVEAGTTPSVEDLNQLEAIRSQWEDFFNDAVEQRAAARTALVRMLRLSTWPAAGVLLGTPGMGSAEIATPLEADLDVMLTTDNAVIDVPAVVTFPAGSTEAPFTIDGLEDGIASLMAVASTPGYDTAYSRVQVRSAVADLTLTVESGDGQAAGDGGLLAQPVVFRLQDENQLPYSGVSIAVTPSADGVAMPSSAVTDAYGRLSVQWQLGTMFTRNTLRAEIEGTPGVNAVAEAFSLGPRPAFALAGVVNAASFNTGPSPPVGIVPGSLVSIFGTALALNPGEAMAFPLPTQLRLTRVTIDGVPVPLLFVSPQQINFQAPFELTGSSVELQIISDAGASDLVTVPLISTQPGIFFDFATGLGAIRNNDDGTTILDRPARAGDFIQVFCTGLGEVVPTGQTGLPAPASPLSLTTRDPRVLIDGRDSLVTFSPHFQFDSDLPTFQRP